MIQNFQDKVAVVTGAASGIGAALVRGCAAQLAVAQLPRDRLPQSGPLIDFEPNEEQQLIRETVRQFAILVFQFFKTTNFPP